MPEYAYVCHRCKKHFSTDMHVKEHDARTPECPICGKADEVHKEMSSVNVKTSRKSASW